MWLITFGMYIYCGSRTALPERIRAFIDLSAAEVRGRKAHVKRAPG